jgi:16S rRNA (guanine527-N7)-methyltransferase
LKNTKPQLKQKVQSGEISSSAIQWRIEEWFSELTAEQKQRLKKYHNELCKFNKVLNLVSPKTLFTADAIHFADAIVSSKIVLEKINKNECLYDIGSGNGFPGLVFSALNLDQKIALVDTDQRKCEFLKHVISVLGLKNTSVENKNIEQFPDGSIFQAVTRGFAPLPRALLVLQKPLAVGAAVYHLKSDDWGQELSQVSLQLRSAWQEHLEGEYNIPSLPHKMYVVKTNKI